MARPYSLLTFDQAEFSSLDEARDFQQTCERTLEREGQDLLLDFTDLHYVNSAFLAALLSVQHACTERQLRLGVAGIRGRVETIFETAKISTVLPTATTLTELRNKLGLDCDIETPGC